METRDEKNMHVYISCYCITVILENELQEVQFLVRNKCFCSFVKHCQMTLCATAGKEKDIRLGSN